MYSKIHIKNAFVHRDLLLDFKEGLTNISGLNGTGKSLVIEMAEFAMWGTEALRFKLESYKGVSVELWFSVKGKDYSVYRTPTSATLSDSKGEAIAKGTGPVNNKVRELFGYSYSVFKVANSTKQSQVLALGQMKPAERKRLVDETIGLSKIEELNTWVGKQYTEVNAERSTVASMIRDPGPEPAAPAEFDEQLYNQLKDQLVILRAETPYAVKPEEVTPHPDFPKLKHLREVQANRLSLLAEIRGLDIAIKGIPDVGPAPSLHPQDAQLEEFKASTKAWGEAAAQVDMMTKALMSSAPEESKHTPEELKAIREAHEMAKRWKAKQELLKTQVRHECPACKHEWFTGDARLADYEDVPDVCPTPAMPLAMVMQEEKVNSYQDTRKTLLEGIVAATQVRDSNKSYAIEIAKIETARRAFEAHQERLKSQETKLELQAKRDQRQAEVPEDVSALVAEIEARDRSYSEYVRKLQRYEEAITRLAQLPHDLPEQVEALNALRDQWITYRANKATWDRDTTVYLQQSQRLKTLEARVEDWKSVKQAITMLRAKIKGYLLPSLNDVASRLISMMSKGWLNKVEVTEDFEIMTDGKPLETLSGAGQTLTNLAIRIGLGQVLTNSVFPSMTLDEADASVDIEKAPMISAALRALTKHIKQIIVISHKQGLEADHYVRF